MDNANIGVICLPGKDDIFDNQDCIVTGWGKSKACEYTIYILLKVLI